VWAERNDRIAGATKKSEATQMIQPTNHAIVVGRKAGMGTTYWSASAIRRKPA
jgi:hypothetical protein